MSCPSCSVAAARRAEQLRRLHLLAEAAGFNGAQVTAELSRVVVELGKDWDRTYEQAVRFYGREVLPPDRPRKRPLTWWSKVLKRR